MAKIPSYLLNLAGEYRVCSELNRRGMFATVTVGNHKGVDLYVSSDSQDRALRVEVKTSQSRKFVTSITQKRLENDPRAPDFWVLLQIRPNPDDTFTDRFFILNHDEICKIQNQRNRQYANRFKKKHGEEPDFSRGVDDVRIEDVAQHEDTWQKIKDALHGRARL